MDELDRYMKKAVSFKPSTEYLDLESITFLKKLGSRGERSKWISHACQMLYDYEKYKKGFLVRMIESNFELCKHILRKLGRAHDKNNL